MSAPALPQTSVRISALGLAVRIGKGPAVRLLKVFAMDERSGPAAAALLTFGYLMLWFVPAATWLLSILGKTN